MRKSDLVFFLTGAAALVYQSVWARLLARVLGSDAAAAGIVIASFMGGMGLGAWLLGPVFVRARDPRRAFAWIEAAVAAWAAASPFLITAVEPLLGFGARAVAGALLLLPPTLLLGATFPLMAKLVIARDREATARTAEFYGANTLGAAAGAVLAPCALMPFFGLAGALWAAAALDVVAVVLALHWLPRVAADEDVERVARTQHVVDGATREQVVREQIAHGHAAHAPNAVQVAGAAHERDARTTRRSIYVASALLGAASLGLEVLLLRIVVSVTGASVYAFALVLAVFLGGLGLGARQIASLSRALAAKAGPRVENEGEHALRLFLQAALWASPLALAGLWALRFQLGENDLFLGLENRIGGGASMARLWASHVLFAGLALLPPAIAFGMALPAAAGALTALRAPRTTRETTLARLYALNTVGALCGSLGAAFVLLPYFGLRGACIVVLVLPLVAALSVARGRTMWVAIACSACALLATQSVWPRPRDGARVLFYEMDPHTSARVEEVQDTRGTSVRALRVNGKSEASTAPVDLRLQYLLGHVPGLVHGAVEHAAVIGLGTGMTAGSLLDLPSLRTLSIFEISPAVTRAARSFDAWNGAVLTDPRTTLAIADGRHALATSERTYDLITADPVHPWTRGSSDLYTLEHFTNVRARLNENGIASQWLPLYELSTRDVRTVVATWCAAFEHTSAWLSAYDLVLVGSRTPHAPRAESTFPASVLRHTAPIGVRDMDELRALQVADDARLRAFAGDEPPMRDDRPVLEYRAPLAYAAGYSTEVLRWACDDAFVESLPERSRVRARDVRAACLRFVERLPTGFTLAADRLGIELLELPPLARER